MLLVAVVVVVSVVPVVVVVLVQVVAVSVVSETALFSSNDPPLGVECIVKLAGDEIVRAKRACLDAEIVNIKISYKLCLVFSSSGCVSCLKKNHLKYVYFIRKGM